MYMNMTTASHIDYREETPVVLPIADLSGTNSCLRTEETQLNAGLDYSMYQESTLYFENYW